MKILKNSKIQYGIIEIQGFTVLNNTAVSVRTIPNFDSMAIVSIGEEYLKPLTSLLETGISIIRHLSLKDISLLNKLGFDTNRNFNEDLCYKVLKVVK